MRSRFTRRAATLALAASVALLGALDAACGDLYADPLGPSGSFDTSPPQIARDASALVPQDIRPACPQPNPVEGAMCASGGLTCELGSSPDMQCNTTLECVSVQTGSAVWTARPSVLCPSYECPRGPSAPLDGMPCDVPTTDSGAPSDADELVCPMTDAVCACTTGTDAAHAHARQWVCVKPAGFCPTKRPLVGEPCSAQGGVESCDYGSCSFKRGMRMECKSNVWISGSATCN